MNRINDYDAFANAYDEANEFSIFNAMYERPATLALVGEVAGRQVLDAGCGGGSLAKHLMARGAAVTGIDASAGLLEIARERLGTGAALLHGDLTLPLELPTGYFDVVAASLVMHYLQDWMPPLLEFHRVLRPGGRLVISTHHPFMDTALSGRDDYLTTFEFDDTWLKNGQQMTMRFWHRPISAMTDAFTSAGFTIERIVEPQPDPSAAAIAPDTHARLTREARFLFFSLGRADERGTGS